MPGWAASTSSEAAASPAPPLLARLPRGVRSSWWRGGRPAWGRGHLAKQFTHSAERLAPSRCSPEWINPSP